MEVGTKSGWETNILGWFTIDWWTVLVRVMTLAGLGLVLCILLVILSLAGVPIVLMWNFFRLIAVTLFNIVVWVCIGLWKVLQWIWTGIRYVYEAIKRLFTFKDAAS